MSALWAGGGPYESWVEALRRWSAGEPVVLAALPTIDLRDLTQDSWERLTNQITEAIGIRLSAWARVLTRAIGDARDEFGISRALVDARAGVQSIRVLAAHPGLPSTLSEQLLDTVDSQIRTAQQQLEQQVESMRLNGVHRSIVETRRRTVRDNALTRAITDVGGAATPAAGWASPSTATGRRVVIIDRDRQENR